jgi:hypothetical protein
MISYSQWKGGQCVSDHYNDNIYDLKTTLCSETLWIRTQMNARYIIL